MCDLVGSVEIQQSGQITTVKMLSMAFTCFDFRYCGTPVYKWDVTAVVMLVGDLGLGSQGHILVAA